MSYFEIFLIIINISLFSFIVWERGDFIGRVKSYANMYISQGFNSDYYQDSIKKEIVRVLKKEMTEDNREKLIKTLMTVAIEDHVNFSSNPFKIERHGTHDSVWHYFRVDKVISDETLNGYFNRMMENDSNPLSAKTLERIVSAINNQQLKAGQ